MFLGTSLQASAVLIDLEGIDLEEFHRGQQRLCLGSEERWLIQSGSGALRVGSASCRSLVQAMQIRLWHPNTTWNITQELRLHGKEQTKYNELA